MGIKKKRKWTVFFLVKSVDSSIHELIFTLNEIRSLRFTDDVAVVFCINIALQNVNAVLSGNDSELSKDDVEKTFTTIFLTLERDYHNQNLPNKLVKFEEKPDFDLTIPDHLTGYFRTQILKKFRAKRYMLFTWDHGNAFGIFSRDPQAKKLMLEANKFSAIDQLDISEKFSRKFVVSEKPDDILTMEELATSLRLGFDERRVDIIAMMNCNMQIVDTGFALKDTAKYLVAAETAMDFDGYNYALIFQIMFDDPKISPRKLSKHIVSSFSKKIFPEDDLGEENKALTAISAVELFYYSYLESFVNRLSDFLAGLLPSAYEIIADARRAAIIELAKELIDVYTFLDILARKQQFKTNTLLASLVFSMKELVLFRTHIGDGFKDSAPERLASNYRPTGLSVYFPEIVVFDEEKLPSLQKTSFFRNTRWKDFVIAFHKAGSSFPPPDGAGT